MPTDENAPWMWLLAGSAVAGLLLGLRFKVAALIAASGLILLIDCIAAVVGGWRLVEAAETVILSLLSIQLTYGVGLFIGYRLRSCGDKG